MNRHFAAMLSEEQLVEVKGQTPVVQDTGGHFGFKLISAVSARSDLYFEVIEQQMNAERFIEFLKN